jgi:hypothetical protein
MLSSVFQYRFTVAGITHCCQTGHIVIEQTGSPAQGTRYQTSMIPAKPRSTDYPFGTGPLDRESNHHAMSGDIILPFHSLV